MDNVKTLPFTDEVLETVKTTMVAQDNFGLKKYGKALDPMDEQYDWLDMAQQELADALKYFTAERKRRDTIIYSILGDLEANDSALSESIKRRLKVLIHEV